MVGVPGMFTILLKKSTLSFHSVESSNTLDAWSAITLITLGMWLIESHREFKIQDATASRTWWLITDWD